MPAPVSAMMPRLAHAQGQHDLAKHIVHLMRAGVIEFFALEIDFGAAAMLREALSEIERRRASYIGCQMAVHFLLEFWVGLGLRVSFLQVEDQGHQRLGDKPATIDAEMPALVGAVAE